MRELLKDLLKAYENNEKIKAYEILKQLRYKLTTGVSEDEVKEFTDELASLLYNYTRQSRTLNLLKEALENIII
ncbi:glutamyl-tRNA amido-transferase subunit E [uncultured virus]|uniref:Glutamyl-tRNA amido-transferase subunit E n=1 Tax=uncultured virus TaxID=340016 RepID=A0A5Q0TWT7_9VIRU|nr:glutamyl-tRNA amido-transferase subunit E [uncultured virus]